MSKAKRVAFIGVPMDLGGGRRGVDMGPSAVRIAGVKKAVESLGFEFVDHGNVDVVAPESRVPDDPKARFLDEIADACTRLANDVEARMDEGDFPLVVGGDHSIAIGTVSGIASHYHKKDEKVGLIWFDAHGDMNTPETSESGNIHGMPLAALLGYGPGSLTRLSRRFPAVDCENAVLVGIRSLDKMEKEMVRKAGIRCITMKEVDQHGIHKVMEEAIQIATNGTAGFHMSFDLDGTDPSVAPGVGTPVPGGISFREAHTVLELCAESGKLVGLEMTEINPILDVRNKTAQATVQFIGSALGRRTL
ncbi:MAG: arginase [Planctomycetota bacterium]|nr:arginase [Planctomycetota bacterium]